MSFSFYFHPLDSPNSFAPYIEQFYLKKAHFIGQQRAKISILFAKADDGTGIFFW
jgi:hypothetical protein